MRVICSRVDFFFIFDIFPDFYPDGVIRQMEISYKISQIRSLTNMKLMRAVTRETIFHAKSKMQPLGEQMNLPVREAQSATSSLPYGNGYALGKFTSLLLSIYLVSRSTDPFTRFSILFRSPLTLFPHDLLSTLSVTSSSSR